MIAPAHVPTPRPFRAVRSSPSRRRGPRGSRTGSSRRRRWSRVTPSSSSVREGRSAEAVRARFAPGAHHLKALGAKSMRSASRRTTTRCRNQRSRAQRRTGRFKQSLEAQASHGAVTARRKNGSKAQLVNREISRAQHLAREIKRHTTPSDRLRTDDSCVSGILFASSRVRTSAVERARPSRGNSRQMARWRDFTTSESSSPTPPARTRP